MWVCHCVQHLHVSEAFNGSFKSVFTHSDRTPSQEEKHATHPTPYFVDPIDQNFNWVGLNPACVKAP